MINQGLAKTDKSVTIKKHTNDLLNLFEDFLSKYNVISDEDRKRIIIACKYHDIGKYNINFQNMMLRIMGERQLDNPSDVSEISHEFLSPLIFTETFAKKMKLSELDLIIIINAINSHHGRFIHYNDYLREIKSNIDYLNENISVIQEEFPEIEKFELSHTLRRLASRKKRIIELFYNDKKSYYSFLIVKGFLNRLDYCASAGLDTIEVLPNANGEYLYEKINKKFSNLKEIQEYMSSNSEENLIVVGATGVGKTEATLLWVKDYKAFYTLPIKVAGNAIHDRILDDYDYDAVRLYHSDANNYYYDAEKSQEDTYKTITEAKLFQSPLTITTIDQLFKFAYMSELTEKDAVVASYSKVIIDELQMYSPELVATIIVGLKRLTEMGGKFAIVTATLPEIFVDKLKALKIPFKRAPKKYIRKNDKDKEMIQHKVKLKNTFDIEKIEKESLDKKVLIVANTVKKAQEIYKELRTRNRTSNINLLHSRFIYKDRSEKEKSILSFAHKKRMNQFPGIWISTSIVEASLDIDFDILHTELTTIDSLLQRMGRVFRHREYLLSEANINIYLNEYSGVINGEISRELLIFTKNALVDLIGDKTKLLKEKDKQLLIDNVYNKDNNPLIIDSEYNKVLDKKIDKLMDITPYHYHKETVNKIFRDIYSATVIPYSVYQELRKEQQFEKWEEMYNRKEYLKLQDELKQFLLSVPGYYVDKKNKCGELSFLNKTYFVLDDKYAYDKHNGLYYDENKE